jgi:hypothetical protein
LIFTGKVNEGTRISNKIKTAGMQQKPKEYKITAEENCKNESKYVRLRTAYVIKLTKNNRYY